MYGNSIQLTLTPCKLSEVKDTLKIGGTAETAKPVTVSSVRFRSILVATLGSSSDLELPEEKVERSVMTFQLLVRWQNNQD